MTCTCIQLERQVAEYQMSRNGNNNQDAAATAQYTFFAGNRTPDENSKIQEIKRTLSILESYVQLYRGKCEKTVGGGIVGGNKWGGRISQSYREYIDTVKQIESQRANSSAGMRMSA